MTEHTENNREESYVTELTDGSYRGARPMKVVIDQEGCNWLCDVDADESKDLESQGCWRCADIPFNRNS